MYSSVEIETNNEIESRRWNKAMVIGVIGLLVLVGTVATVTTSNKAVNVSTHREAVAASASADLNAHMATGTGGSCLSVCRNSASLSNPLQTGVYKNNYGNPFYMCAANYGNEGYRGGYQIGTVGKHCVVPWGGKELGVSHYKCVCESHLVEYVFGNSKNCEQTCKAWDNSLSAVVTGVYKGNQNNKFYACAANYGNEGYRGGYNLGGSTACVVPWGGRELAMRPFMCVCI